MSIKQPYLILLLSSTMLFGCFGNKKSNNFDKKKQELVSQLGQSDWEAPEKVMALIEPNIYTSDGVRHRKGRSKYGGAPDLPNSIKWPEYNGKPMVFFGQINLAEATLFDIDKMLPETGLLYFFAYFKKPDNEFGAEYEFQIERDRYQVLYFDGNLEDLVETEFPKQLPNEYNFKEIPIVLNIDFRVSSTTDTWKYQAQNLSTKDKELYEALLEGSDFCVGETMLGTPCPVQDAVEVDWSYSYIQSSDYQSEEVKKQVETLRPNFINLFSFGMWGKFDSIGTSGCYFGILKDDLKQRDFSKTVFVMQDT